MVTSLLAKMATDTRFPQMPMLPIRRVAARVRWENRVKIAILASCTSYSESGSLAFTPIFI